MYKITYVDGTTFLGGSPTNSKWNSMPNKPVKRVTCYIANKPLIFENYNSYNLIIEHVAKLIGNTSEVISKIYFMAQWLNDVHMVIFDILHNKIVYHTAVMGQEYCGRATSGWKEGTVDEVPKFYAKE